MGQRGAKWDGTGCSQRTRLKMGSLEWQGNGGERRTGMNSAYKLASCVAQGFEAGMRCAVRGTGCCKGAPQLRSAFPFIVLE